MTVLERILAEKTVEDEQGNVLPLSQEIAPEDGEVISSCIQHHSISRTLEIGCAYGISSLYICEAISNKSDPHHIMIDAFQTSYRNIGVNNLRKAGFHCWQLVEQLSEIALPKLLQSGVRVQFALIDGYHTFDHALLDFFYVDRLLEDGGIVAFDDAYMPAIDRVIRYVLRYPNYELLEAGRQPPVRKSNKRRLFEFTLRRLSRIMPAHNQEEYFDDRWLRPAEEIGLGSRCILVQKSRPVLSDQCGASQNRVEVDEREAYSVSTNRQWDWYRHF
jgi:predicted O-methyltransferase YrrM